MACDNATTANTALVSALTRPAKASSDTGSVEQRSVSELIQAANYLAGQCASSSPRRGIRFSKMVPPGTVDRGCRTWR